MNRQRFKQEKNGGDDVKVITCILVVLEHLFQSKTKANVLLKSVLYKWFNSTICYFHVSLFFICSLYLYQKYSKINNLKSWKKNVGKRALALGMPYVTFSAVTGYRNPVIHVVLRLVISFVGSMVAA